MLILRRIKETRAYSRTSRARGETVALVPTMGFLHDGHLSLIRTARDLADRVIVSIFVNPTQFGPNEDFERYPRDLARDKRLCEAEGVDVIFLPEASEMYPGGHATFVDVEGPLTLSLCAASRPGHFRGVATVVTKLFNICEPDVAVFGQKDAQQAAVIRRFTADLDLPVRIVVAPIVREDDGLAMSSRNVYLSDEERVQARSLNASLQKAREIFASGERDGAVILEAVKEAVASQPLAKLEYAELVDHDSLEPIRIIEKPALLAVAARFGTTRLIDNTLLPPQTGN